MGNILLKLWKINYYMLFYESINLAKYYAVNELINL